MGSGTVVEFNNLLLHLILLPILAWAGYRATRFLVIDTLIEGLRDKFHTFLANKRGKTAFIWHKGLELTSCTWCTGFYASVALYSLVILKYPWDFGRFGWVYVLAVAGIQGFLHSVEPDDE